MGVRTIIVSDYNGKELKDGTKPTKLTIQQPGATAKDAKSYDLYLSEDDLADLFKRLDSGKPLMSTDKTPSTSATKTDATPTEAAERRREAFDRFSEYANKQGITKQQAAADIKAWLVDNPIERERGDGFYTQIAPNAKTIAPKVVDAYLLASA